MHAILTLLGFSRPNPAPEAVEPPALPPNVVALPEPVLPANTPMVPPVARVTATELWHAFQTNAAAAEKRYGHQPLYVSGAVERVDRDGAFYVVKLAVCGSAFDTVRCRISDRNRFNVARLRQGALVMVLGRKVVEVYGRLVLEESLVIEDDLAGLVGQWAS